MRRASPIPRLQPLIGTAAACMALLSPPAYGAAALGFASTNGAFLDGNTRMIGWQFSVPQAASLSALGWFDWGQDGLNREHEVGVWELATQQLVATIVVPAGTAAGLDGWFRYQSLSVPVVLQAGVDYRIAGLDIGAAGDPHVWAPFLSGFNAHVNGFTVDAGITLGPVGTALGGAVGAFGFPTGVIGDARQALMGPNLMLSAVPEPAAWGLLVAGLAAIAWRRRVAASIAPHEQPTDTDRHPHRG